MHFKWLLKLKAKILTLTLALDLLRLLAIKWVLFQIYAKEGENTDTPWAVDLLRLLAIKGF